MSLINDSLVLKFGKFKGERIGDVPAWYLLWVVEQPWISKYPLIEEYILKHERQLLREKEEVQDETELDFYGDR